MIEITFVEQLNLLRDKFAWLSRPGLSNDDRRMQEVLNLISEINNRETILKLATELHELSLSKSIDEIASRLHDMIMRGYSLRVIQGSSLPQLYNLILKESELWKPELKQLGKS